MHWTVFIKILSVWFLHLAVRQKLIGFYFKIPVIIRFLHPLWSIEPDPFFLCQHTCQETSADRCFFIVSVWARSSGVTADFLSPGLPHHLFWVLSGDKTKCFWFRVIHMNYSLLFFWNSLLLMQELELLANCPLVSGLHIPDAEIRKSVLVRVFDCKEWGTHEVLVNQGKLIISCLQFRVGWYQYWFIWLTSWCHC